MFHNIHILSQCFLRIVPLTHANKAHTMSTPSYLCFHLASPLAHPRLWTLTASIHRPETLIHSKDKDEDRDAERARGTLDHRESAGQEPNLSLSAQPAFPFSTLTLISVLPGSPAGPASVSHNISWSFVISYWLWGCLAT